jgi:hypothetical protein
VTTAKVPSSKVTTNQVTINQVTTDEVTTNQVTTNKLTTDQVTSIPRVTTVLCAVPALPQPDHSKLARRKPVQYVDIYVDDYIGLVQGGPPRQNRVRRILFESIDLIFRPLSPDDPDTRQEPISVKKLLKGDGAWRTRKTILGWVVDSVCHTIELPPGRLLRLQAILDELPETKTRIATKQWEQLLGKLCSMVLAVPGLRGLFSLLQETLCHKERQRIRITPHMHDFLNDIRWIVADLHARPTCLREIIDTPVAAIGASDAAAAGMGGVLFIRDQTGRLHPILWRAPFPLDIQHSVVSSSNPNGSLTNSDLELAGTIAHHDVLVHQVDCRERTIHTLTANTPALAWQSGNPRDPPPPRASLPTSSVSKPSTNATIDTSHGSPTSKGKPT